MMRKRRRELAYASETHLLKSKYLGRYKRVDVFLPGAYYQRKSTLFSVVLMNDGQDARALKIRSTVEHSHESGNFEPFILIAIPAQCRLREYGTQAAIDYKGRGDRALAYSQFIVHEVLPFIRGRYRVHRAAEKTHFMGFSLGALSALDIVWHNPSSFGSVGVFSGSLWWRRKPRFKGESEDDCRIIHEVIRKGPYRKGLKFWFQAGTLDETEDRNQNGIIDAIDDTLDLIKELIRLGYVTDQEIKYLEVKGGRHNAQTWCRVIPAYLHWILKKQ